MKGLITIFITISVLLVVSGVGLGLIIKYPYLDPLSNQVRNTCIMTNCGTGDLAYCGKQQSCVSYHYDYTLMYNGTNYTKTFSGTTSDIKICSYFYYIDCYYDDRNVIESFTTQNDHLGVILGIICMTCIVFICFVLFIIVKIKLIVAYLDTQKVTYV
jgi:hypothetical protein